jgi:hypothetical protein
MLPAPSALTRVLTAGFDSLNYLSDMQSFGSPLYITSDSTAQYNGLYPYQGPSRAIENVALAYATNNTNNTMYTFLAWASHGTKQQTLC